MACGLGLVMPAAPGAEISTEYQIKAAFLYNFTKFVEWPATSFADAGSPIQIAALCPAEFGEALNRIVDGRKVNGRSVVAITLDPAGPVPASHVLFVCSASDHAMAGVAREIGAKPVLTVGESEAFRAAGGIIIFVRDGDKLRFVINSGAAERAGLKLSSQLRKLAKPAAEAPKGP